MGILEIIALISTILCVVLSTKQNVIAWPTGICSAISLICIYIESGMYANIVLQGVFVLQCSIGWYNWGKKDVIKVSSLSNLKLLQDISIFIALGCIYAGCDIGFNNRISWIPSHLDGISTALALLGNWYLTKKIIQAWPLFMTYNVMIGILLFSQGIYTIAALNACLFFISLNGFITWRRDLIKV